MSKCIVALAMHWLAAWSLLGVIRVISWVRQPLPVYTQHQKYRRVAANGRSGPGAVIVASRDTLERHPLFAVASAVTGEMANALYRAYRSGRAVCWLKVKNPAAPAVTREAEEDWN